MEFSETIVVYDLKLAIDDRNDKKFLLTSKLCPLGAVCPQHRGYIHVLNHEKNCIKSRLQRDFFETQQKGKVIRPFCWHQNFVPWGLWLDLMTMTLFSRSLHYKDFGDLYLVFKVTPALWNSNFERKKACVHTISWTNGWNFTKVAQIHH